MGGSATSAQGPGACRAGREPATPRAGPRRAQACHAGTHSMASSHGCGRTGKGRRWVSRLGRGLAMANGRHNGHEKGERRRGMEKGRGGSHHGWMAVTAWVRWTIARARDSREVRVSRLCRERERVVSSLCGGLGHASRGGGVTEGASSWLGTCSRTHWPRRWHGEGAHTCVPTWRRRRNRPPVRRVLGMGVRGA